MRKVLARYSSLAIASQEEEILMPVWISSKCSVCVRKTKSRWKIHNKGTEVKTLSLSLIQWGIAVKVLRLVLVLLIPFLTFRLYVSKRLYVSEYMC